MAPAQTLGMAARASLSESTGVVMEAVIIFGFFCLTIIAVVALVYGHEVVGTEAVKAIVETVKNWFP